MIEIISRFAPSPTGNLHLGNVRTALFSFLYSLNQQGKFLLRIEDTDIARSNKIYTTQLLKDLQWLQIDWQLGPFYQAQRLSIYEKYYQQLIDEKKAYFCFCNERELEISRKAQLRRGQAPKYSGKCRSLSLQECKIKKQQGLKASLRFHVRYNSEIVFTDLLKAKQKFYGKEIGDFIIRRSNNMPSFMFCNAIDDSLMNVSVVMRGEDHLTNTPRQLAILQACKLSAPKYAHLPLITGNDALPLSKRNGSRGIKDLKATGITSLALLNYLSRLGHTYQNENLLSKSELIANFNLDNLHSSHARYDEQQLLYWQKKHLQNMTNAELFNWLQQNLQQQINNFNLEIKQQQALLQIIRENCYLQQQVKELLIDLFSLNAQINPDSLSLLKETPAEFFAYVIATLQEKFDFSYLKNQLQQKFQLKGKKIFLPLRLVLSNRQHGSNLDLILQALGKKLVIKKFNKLL